MKQLLPSRYPFAAFHLCQEKKDLRSLLVKQLKSICYVKGWFLPIDTAIASLTVDQAMW